MGFENPKLTAFVCPHVFNEERPVLYVCRDDSGWQFLCGDDDFEGGGGPHIVGVGHLIERDPSINLVSDLPEDWEAERFAVGTPWMRQSMSD